jgi:GT2 family glycosyltransferase
MIAAAMTERVPVSVMIPTIGRPDLLRACLESIFACDQRPAEVLVVDQSAGSATTDLVAEFSELGAISYRSRPPGLPRALNDGLMRVRSDFLLVTNDDCTVDPSWIRIGAELAAASRQPALLTGRVFPVGDPDMVPSIKTDPEPHDYTGERRFDVLYPNNMVLPARPALELGGFDQVISGAEDNDFCYRWLKAGYRLEYRPELIVFHHDWRTREQLETLYTRYWYGNGQLYGKHLRRGDLRMLRYLSRDAAGFVRAAASRCLRGQTSGTPYAKPMLRGLPAGLVNGLRRTKPRRES